jgi:IS5 family transposase
MLRDRYEPDPRFWAIVEQLAIEMDPELAQIDGILEDDELFQMIKYDLSKNRPKTLETGRNSTPVEVIARMLAVKRLYDLSYEKTERHVNDSLVLRWFCRVYFHPVLDHSNLNKWALLIQPDTLHAFNDRITAIATELKLTRGRKLRTDGTVVETNIHYPTDSSLLADGVRVLSRTIQRAKEILVGRADMTAKTFRDRTRSARNQARCIADKARRRGAEAKTKLKEVYRRLVSTTKANVQQAKQVLEALKEQGSKQANQLAATLEQFIPRVEQVIEQAVRRVFEEDIVPAQEKIVSIFEPHTDIIRRNKAQKPTEFGHKVWLDEIEGGIVTNYQVLEGNPPDRDRWQPTLEHHVQQFGKPPNQASADRGVYSPDNEAYATEIGVKRVILPKPGRKSATRRQHEQQRWFKRGRRFHAGVEGRISVLKRKHGLGRCLYHGEDGFERWVGWGVIAGNLAVMGTALAARG